MVLIITRCPSAITIRKLKKKYIYIKVYDSEDLEITQHIWGHTARPWVERGREHGACRGLGFCFYWVSRWESKVSCSRFIDEFKM